MPKVSVTIKSDSGTRTYKGDYVFVTILEDLYGSPSGRWIQEPPGWKGGQGLFFTALELLRSCAEQKGDEAFIQASRDALDSIKTFEKEGDSNGSEEDESDNSCAADNLEGSGGSAPVPERSGESSESGGSSDHDLSSDVNREGSTPKRRTRKKAGDEQGTGAVSRGRLQDFAERLNKELGSE
jgi:hypothetical protein